MTQHEMTIELKNGVDDLHVTRDETAEIAKQMGFEDHDLWGIVSAVFEACVNAVTHGSVDACDHPVVLTIRNSENRFEAVVQDHGKGCFPPPESPMPSPDSRRGRGIPLMRAFMDEVTFDYVGGCRVTLVKILPQKTGNNT
jgi:serine/threonine-protein kinase RsbW